MNQQSGISIEELLLYIGELYARNRKLGERERVRAEALQSLMREDIEGADEELSTSEKM